jgi:cold shock CspA family protein
MGLIKPVVKTAGVKTAVVKTAVKAAAKTGECKWCEQGECWTHGQIEKPKGMGKGFKGKGKGKGFNGGGGNGDLIQALVQALAGGGGGGGWGKGSKGKGSWGNNFKVDKSGGELGEFTGTIKSFNDKTNYGFIESEEASQGDIFLHGDMKKGFRQGHTVKFTCVLNKDGKAVAIDLKSGLK